VAEGTEPSNLLESMLGTLLVFVRQCPQVGEREVLVLWTTRGFTDFVSLSLESSCVLLRSLMLYLVWFPSLPFCLLA
jgi:hypothetical protein